MQPLIHSRITYAAPYLKLAKKNTVELDTIIRKAYKLALELPMNTSTKKLLSLRVHNIFIELAET